MKSDPRIAFLNEAIRTAREANGLPILPGKGEVFDITVNLPVATLRNLVLLSDLAFGILDLRRLAFTDPSRVKRFRRLKDKFDDYSPPERSLWDQDQEAKYATMESAIQSSSTKPQRDPSEEELFAELQREAKDAIYLRRVWPIGAVGTRLSWLGGTPCLPKSIPWPRTPDTQTALHFLAQVNCAELPRVTGGEAMPKSGLLLFFADLNGEMIWEEQGSTRVIYVSANVAPDDPVPVALKTPEIGYERGNINGAGDRPGVCSFPRWPITAHSIKTYFWDFGMPKAKLSLASNLHTDAMCALLPEPSEAKRNAVIERRRVAVHSNNDESAGANKELITQYLVRAELVESGFPYCGAVMSRFAAELEGNLLAKLMQERQKKEYSKSSGNKEWFGQIESSMARLTEHLVLLEAVSTRLNALEDLTKPDAETQQWFVRWLEQMQSEQSCSIEEELRNALLSVVQQAVTDSEMRSVLPNALFDFFDRVLRPTPTQSEHMMFGHAQLKTNSTRGDGVRLLALDSDYGLNFMFCDVGMIEFWISSEDLQRRDFDRARAYTAGG